MSLQDPIADMLTRIRNANRVGRKALLIPRSKICRGIAEVLTAEGYITGHEDVDDAAFPNQGAIRINLKYSLSGDKVINEIKRISKPGRRVYSGVETLPKVLGGLGISVVSTSKGVMSDRRAREQKVGGELLCQVS